MKGPLIRRPRDFIHSTVGFLLFAVTISAGPISAPASGATGPDAPTSLGAYAGSHVAAHSVIVEATSGARLRLTAYGDYMLRVQVAPAQRDFLPDDWLPMIEHHDLGGQLRVTESPDALVISTAAADGVSLTLAKPTLKAEWRFNGQATPQLVESTGVSWANNSTLLAFDPDATEHFAGVGHGFYGRDAAPLDLHGRTISRAYGFQASLVVPWFISSKGYGFFLNCAFPHRFRFDVDAHFDVAVQDTDLGAQLDYVVVAGRTPLQLIDRYRSSPAARDCNAARRSDSRCRTSRTRQKAWRRA